MSNQRLLLSSSLLLLVFLQACGGGENQTAAEPDTGLTALSKSALLPVTVAARAPTSAPVNLWVAPRQGQLVVEWTNVPGATGYHVYRRLAGDGQGATPYRSTTNAAILFDTGLSAGATYYYQVAAMNAAGVGPRTIEVGGTPTAAQAAEPAQAQAPATPPAPATAPVNLWVTRGAGQLVVEWASVAGATGYNVYRSLLPGGQDATLHRINLNAGVLFDTGLSAGTAYYYQVAAVNAGGVGPRTMTVGAKPAAAQPAGSATVPPSGSPSGPGPAMVSPAAVGSLADLVLINFTGDCDGVRARVFNRSTGRFFGFNDPAPCQNPAYAAPRNLYSGLLARAVSGQLPVVELLQTAAGQRLSAGERIGDCRVQHVQVQDEYVGTPLNFVTAKSCSDVGMTHDAQLPTRLIAHYLRSGVEPIMAAAPYSPALTRCDKTVDPATLGQALATITNGADGDLNSQWQVVCLTPGTYAGPYTLRGAHHVMLVAKQPGTVKLRTQLPLSTGAVGAPLSVWYGSNVVLQNIDFENAHQFAYNPPHADPRINLQYSVGLFMAYVRGSLVDGGNVTSGGKTGMWLQDATHLRARNLTLYGAYFALTTENSSLLAEGMTITTRHPIERLDEHTTTWLDNSAIVFKDTRLLPFTGRGFASGRADPTRNAIYMKNVESAPVLDAWLQQNPSYGGLHLMLQGSYPASAVDYFYNLYNGGGPSANMAVIKR